MRKEIFPLRFGEGGISLSSLQELFGKSSYQARNLSRACAIYKRMLEEDSVIGLTLAGAMTPAGIGGYIAQMMEMGFIDFIVTTGSNITHDTHFPLGGRVMQGSPDVNDLELLEEGVERVYDTYLMPDALTETGKVLVSFIDETTFSFPLSSSEFHYKLGHFLRSRAKGDDPEKRSFLITSSLYNVPVWTPAFGDSEIGMRAALRDLDFEDRHLSVSSSLDVNELCALVYGVRKSKKIGIIAVGGGSPKNFFTQTSPLLLENIYFPKEAEENPGHDYIIKITTDTPVYGGCSGATPSENISWKKFDPAILGSGEVVVHCDATIALPFIFGFAFENVSPREPKKLYEKLPSLMKELKEARKRRLEKFGINSFRKNI